ncbi:YitT family protein [Secundilactobacillus hailunensis]|uniref:YitT family protein n=1 Tax=Secundilactobacillus hailunensis TaxID=2559923 RepID=A0ABW1T6Z4_9LACO|nr:YitT family protein [Secundilactobacillus hailunensis]
MRAILKNGLQIIIGALVYALAINYFLIPNRIGEGGVTGLTALGYYTLRISPALTNIVLNGILILIGFKFLKRETVFYSLWAVLWISIFLRVPVFWPYHTTQTVIAAITGGVLMGISMGLIFRAKGTIAGSTILAKIVNRYFGIRNGSAMLFFDLIVAIPSGLVIGFQNMLLTVLELYVSAVVLNKYLDMVGAKRSVLVFSPKNQAIGEALSTQLGQGITMLKATGFYSKKDTDALFYVCSNRDWTAVMPIIMSVDPDALVVTDQIRSVRGVHLLDL